MIRDQFQDWIAGDSKSAATAHKALEQIPAQYRLQVIELMALAMSEGCVVTSADHYLAQLMVEGRA